MRVLIVEDEVKMASLLRRGLQEEGLLPIEAEPTDLVDVLRVVDERFGARATNEGRSLSIDADGAPVFTADRLRLEQALGNMVDNAFRHGKGKVSLTVARKGSTVELHVLDEGPGFAESFREQAFDRFTRAAEPGTEGSGLGLAIVETIARAHEGYASAANRADGGADVCISLPL